MKFSTDAKLGEGAVETFTDWLDKHNIRYRPANSTEQIQGIDVVLDGNINCEVKHQSFPKSIVIEESSLKNGGSGWIYTTKSKWLIEVSEDRKTMWNIDVTDLKKFYNDCKENYLHHQNEKTEGVYGDEWISSFRVIPLADMKQYVKIEEINEEIQL